MVARSSGVYWKLKTCKKRTANLAKGSNGGLQQPLVLQIGLHQAAEVLAVVPSQLPCALNLRPKTQKSSRRVSNGVLKSAERDEVGVANRQ